MCIVIGGFRPTLSVSVFHGSLIVDVIMADSGQNRYRQFSRVISLPVGVGVFLRRENPEFAILAAILENTRRGGAGRAIVDKEATRGEGGGRREKKEGKNAYWITIPR